ncbi:MAG: hypothetical protein HXY40_07245 [Chloroflexi bacterium]|nr:hypothetical protein [Chloroflexota bacterium]
MSIWQFQRMVMLRLIAWGAASIVTGTYLARAQSKFWRGVGEQFVGWGFINSLIALFGGSSSSYRMRNHPQALEPEYIEKETTKLTRLLWLNAVLDVFYVAGGAFMALRHSSSRRMRGAGWGIIVQGAFLFVFDLVHALLAPPSQRSWRFWDYSHGEARAIKPVEPELE